MSDRRRYYNLLVVDFDYFVPMPRDDHDWGLFETDFMTSGGGIWQIRAAEFAAQGQALPVPNGEQLSFWQRFRFAPSTQLYYAESNAFAVHAAVTNPGIPRHVWLYDAHHDSGYKNEEPLEVTLAGRYNCENWMLWYAYAALRTRCVVRFPAWKPWIIESAKTASLAGEYNWQAAIDDGSSPSIEFDRIFVCRSGAWVGPWCDQAFADFIDACPASYRQCIEPCGELPPRQWDQAEIDAMASRIRGAVHRSVAV